MMRPYSDVAERLIRTTTINCANVCCKVVKGIKLAAQVNYGNDISHPHAGGSGFSGVSWPQPSAGRSLPAPSKTNWPKNGNSSGRLAVREGRLEQTDPDRRSEKAILMVGNEDEDSTDVMIKAKLRLDGATRDPKSRVGISVCSNPKTAMG